MAAAPRPPDHRVDPGVDHRASARRAGAPGVASATTPPEARGVRVSVHHDGAATITPVPGARVTAAGLRHHLDLLGAHGVHRVTTSALSPRDAAPWEAAGFAPATRLVLLRVDLWTVRPTAGRRRRGDATPRIRAGRRRDWPTLADIDTTAFAPHAGLGREGLDDAMAVTPAARVRVAGRPPVGFVIAGHDVRCGYLQRLAVAPAAQGGGLGGALVDDTLRWFRRRGAREALVNTEVGNDRALALYERHGFVRQAEGLVVLECTP